MCIRDRFIWGYYPPSEFKVLLYFPEYDSFTVTKETYTRYAFDSYYEVDMSGQEIQSVLANDTIKAVKNYNYTWEVLSLIIRIIATILIEVLIALLFGFRYKNQLFLICAVNIMTQTILNILLNLIDYMNGSFMLLFHYIWMEALVILIEMGVYYVFLKKQSGTVMVIKTRILLFTLMANVASFMIGLLLAQLISGLF